MGYTVYCIVCILYPGMGAGAGAAIFGELARTSTKKERTAVFSVFMSMRQIGLIIGRLTTNTYIFQ